MIQMYVQQPALSGNADGILTLMFLQPLSAFSFGAAVSNFSGRGLLTTSLFDPTDGALGSSTLDPVAGIGSRFSEALFTCTGAPVGSASLDFGEVEAPGQFAFANLRFTDAQISTVPEPASVVMLMAGLAMLCVLSARRRTA